MKRALEYCAAALGLAALVLLTVPLHRRAKLQPPERFEGRAAFAERTGRGPLRAGLGEADIAVAPGAPIAGYAGWRSWDGRVESTPRVRALALEMGGQRAVLAAVDTLLIPPGLEAEIFQRASLPADACALIAATHTHSGPGGAWDSALAGLLGAGRFDRAQRDRIADAAAAAIRQAFDRLAPAAGAAWREPWHDPPAQPRTGERIDPTLTVIGLAPASDGAFKPAAIFFAMHPTSQGRTRALSADWPGATGALTLQGAVGNATYSRALTTQQLGAAVASASRALVAKPFAGLIDSLTCSLRFAALPPPQASAAIAWPLRRAAENVFAFLDPRFAPQLTLKLGPLTLLGVPGEPTAALAQKDVQLVGLADGYVGYVESARAVQSGTGEAARTWFGPGLADSLGLEHE